MAKQRILLNGKWIECESAELLVGDEVVPTLSDIHFDDTVPIFEASAPGKTQFSFSLKCDLKAFFDNPGTTAPEPRTLRPRAYSKADIEAGRRLAMEDDGSVRPAEVVCDTPGGDTLTFEKMRAALAMVKAADPVGPPDYVDLEAKVLYWLKVKPDAIRPLSTIEPPVKGQYHDDYPDAFSYGVRQITRPLFPSQALLGLMSAARRYWTRPTSPRRPAGPFVVFNAGGRRVCVRRRLANAQRIAKEIDGYVEFPNQRT